MPIQWVIKATQAARTYAIKSVMARVTLTSLSYRQAEVTRLAWAPLLCRDVNPDMTHSFRVRGSYWTHGHRIILTLWRVSVCSTNLSRLVLRWLERTFVRDSLNFPFRFVSSEFDFVCFPFVKTDFYPCTVSSLWVIFSTRPTKL